MTWTKMRYDIPRLTLLDPRLSRADCPPERDLSSAVKSRLLRRDDCLDRFIASQGDKRSGRGLAFETRVDSNTSEMQMTRNLAVEIARIA